MFYRGKEGQWSWIFHRVTGVGVLLFLFIHIIDTFLIGWGPEVYDKVMVFYRKPLFLWGELGLFASVLFHALNGVRVILVDFWPEGTRHHRKMFYAEMAVFVLAMIPVSILMLKRAH